MSCLESKALAVLRHVLLFRGTRFATMMAKRVDGGFRLEDCTLAKRSLAGHRSSCGGA
jgi:hypothetical protein